MIQFAHLTRRLINKVRRIPSWISLKALHIYTQTVRHIVSTLTNRYWLIDYFPRSGTDCDSILLVKLDLIGDFIIWLDAAKEFRALYPGKQIVLYANAAWAALADRLPYWDEVVSVDMTRLREDDLYRLKLLCATHARGFSIAIQPTYSREYAVDLIIRATCARQRIGHLGDLNNISPENKAITDSWYTKLVAPGSRQEVELNINAQLIRDLGDGTFKSRIPNLTKLIDLPNELIVERPYCVIVPGASWAPKRWAFENFAEVARALHVNEGFTIVLCGTSSESDLCNKIAELSHVDVINLAGQTTLIQMVEVIRGAALLVANDSASIHIAAATRTASVCILGGGHFGRFLPYQPEAPEDDQTLLLLAYSRMDCYGCRWRCPYLLAPDQTVPCISGVTVAQVLNSTRQVRGLNC